MNWLGGSKFFQMCGIVGILAFKASIHTGALERATDSLAHRGPDDSGTILLKHDNPEIEIGLGHRRLAIIDLTPLGHQPMRDPATGNWIVYNGEIYNFVELRKELEAIGIEFKTHSDTEVILLAYRVWGESCVARLRGMFALGLWDESKKRLLLARDPMGVKPLYYYQSSTSFILLRFNSSSRLKYISARAFANCRYDVFKKPFGMPPKFTG